MELTSCKRIRPQGHPHLTPVPAPSDYFRHSIIYVFFGRLLWAKKEDHLELPDCWLIGIHPAPLCASGLLEYRTARTIAKKPSLFGIEEGHRPDRDYGQWHDLIEDDG